MYARGKMVSQVERSNWYTLIHRFETRSRGFDTHAPTRTIREPINTTVSTLPSHKYGRRYEKWRVAASLTRIIKSIPPFSTAAVKFIDANRAHLSWSLRNESFRSISIEKSFAPLSRSKCSLNNSHQDARQIAIWDIAFTAVLSLVSPVYIPRRSYVCRVCAATLLQTLHNILLDVDCKWNVTATVVATTSFKKGETHGHRGKFLSSRSSCEHNTVGRVSRCGEHKSHVGLARKQAK